MKKVSRMLNAESRVPNRFIKSWMILSRLVDPVRRGLGRGGQRFYRDCLLLSAFCLLFAGILLNKIKDPFRMTSPDHSQFLIPNS